MPNPGTTLGLGMVAAAIVVIAIYYPKVDLSNTSQTSMSLALSWLILAFFMLIAGIVTLVRSRRVTEQL
ncbi:MAG TPA: hypothetical protein VLX56_01730 [Nitrososphaerales archaeon]|nr:hypothetical protein [Nitrososphaerales archaeon]